MVAGVRHPHLRTVQAAITAAQIPASTASTTSTTMIILIVILITTIMAPHILTNPHWRTRRSIPRFFPLLFMIAVCCCLLSLMTSVRFFVCGCCSILDGYDEANDDEA